MNDLERQVDAVCTAPVGCAFLLIIEAAGITPEVAARPAIVLGAAAIAQRELSPFHPDHDWTVGTVLAEGPRLRRLARRILSQPHAAWIFGPLERDAQLWVSPDGSPPDPTAPITPDAPPTYWERYAQKTARRISTSTLVDGTSSRLAAFAHWAGDWHQEPPITQHVLRVDPESRVFEVVHARAWHRLCLTYPAQYDRGQLVPDWSAVAREWDGVHLTLGGLLAAEQVRIESAAGWTEDRGWDAEQTLWLRWSFTSVARLQALGDFSNPPVSLRWPMWIFERRIERNRRGEGDSSSGLVKPKPRDHQ